MDFVELKINCLENYRDILIAEMGVLGFDSMIETDTGFNAYIDEGLYDPDLVESLKTRYEDAAKFDFTTNKVPKENWNKTWESNYDPIEVEGRCIVRASFHAVDKGYEYDIIIDPKMSFGTGHHETTYLMLAHQMGIDHQAKKVMDAGCGTGILAIMASLRGATSIDAFDIDEWCVENSGENIKLNQLDNINLYKGSLETMKFDGLYDIIIANINKNVLLEEMHLYAQFLREGGLLLLSGFYEDDIEDIEHKAKQYGLLKSKQSVRNNWASIVLNKSSI